jgi:hypothetical protein
MEIGARGKRRLPRERPMYGARQWLWGIASLAAAYLQGHPNCSKAALAQLIDDWSGLLVSDGYGTLPLVSMGGAADHRRHHAGQGHQKDPPASETFCRPTSHCTSPCPPGSHRLILRLTTSRASQTRLRPLPCGGPTPPPSPSPPDISPPTVSGWGDLAVRRQRLPSAPCGCPCVTEAPWPQPVPDV